MIILFFQALEELTWQAGDILDRLDDLQEDLARSDFADDVSGAKHGIDLHNEMKKKIVKVPVEELEAQGNSNYVNKVRRLPLSSLFPRLCYVVRTIDI